MQIQCPDENDTDSQPCYYSWYRGDPVRLAGRSRDRTRRRVIQGNTQKHKLKPGPLSPLELSSL